MIKWEGERERARMLQRLRGSRAVGQWSHAQDNLSFKSCSSSLAFDTEEVRSASSKDCERCGRGDVGIVLDCLGKRERKILV